MPSDLTDEQISLLETAVARGDGAARLLAEQSVQDFFNEREMSLRKEWDNSDPSESDKRETLYYDRRAMFRLLKDLTIVVERGKFAEDKLREKAQE